MNDNINVQSTAAEQAEHTEPTETKDTQQTKTFTQEEVDSIVEKRLARERKKLSGMVSGMDPRELELEEREKAVAKREMQVTARGLLNTNGLPEEALELLNYASEDALEESVGILKSIVDRAKQGSIDRILRGTKPMKKAPEYSDSDTSDIRGAFGLTR